MVTVGLLVRLPVKPGKEAQVEELLRTALPAVDAEPATTAWFAFQLGPRTFGIFDVFPDNGARFIHMVGPVPRELARHAMTWLGSVPEVEMVSVQAEKLGI